MTIATLIVVADWCMHVYGQYLVALQLTLYIPCIV